MIFFIIREMRIDFQNSKKRCNINNMSSQSLIKLNSLSSYQLTEEKVNKLERTGLIGDERERKSDNIENLIFSKQNSEIARILLFFLKKLTFFSANGGFWKWLESSMSEMLEQRGFRYSPLA